MFLIVCIASRLRIRNVECTIKVPCFSLPNIVIIIVGIIVEKLMLLSIPIFVVRNSVSFSSEAIILLSRRLWYSPLLCRFNFCFILFCIISVTSFFISHSKMPLIYYLWDLYWFRRIKSMSRTLFVYYGMRVLDGRTYRK